MYVDTLSCLAVVHSSNVYVCINCCSDEEESDKGPVIPPLQVAAANLETIIYPEIQTPKLKPLNNKSNTTVQKEKLVADIIKLNIEYQTSMRIAFEVWTSATNIEANAERACPGHMYDDGVQAHAAAKRAEK